MTDARNVTQALSGRWAGRYGICRCPAHDDRNPSLSVADGGGGRLLLRCFAGCDFGDVLAALRGLGLVEGAGRTFAPDPAEAAMRAEQERAERGKRTRQARELWDASQPIEGTLGETYLRNRGVRGPLPGALRFHPACWHRSARRFPALVAVVHLGGDTVAAHRTYLADPGHKADVDPCKAMLGPTAGAAVRLSEGAGPLVVAEGVETTLAVLDGLAGLSPRAWAALSASGMAGLRLPPQPGEIAIAPDGDPAGRKAVEELARRAFGLGWAVRIMEPPGDGLDRADLAATVGTIGTIAGGRAA